VENKTYEDRFSCSFAAYIANRADGGDRLQRKPSSSGRLSGSRRCPHGRSQYRQAWSSARLIVSIRTVYGATVAR